MSNAKFLPWTRLSAFSTVRPGTLCWPKLLSVAAVVLGSACAEGANDGPQQPPGYYPFPEAGFPLDAGFPAPVFNPPPTNAAPASNAAPVTSTTSPVNTAPTLPMDNGTFDSGGASPDAGKPDAGAGDAGTDGSSSEPSASNPCGTGPEPLAANIRISEVSLYQTVKVPLYKNSAWLTMRNAALVQGKKSLVRAFVEPGSSYTPHALRGVLTLDTDGKKTVLASERTIMRASTDEAADSTFDFKVDGALIGGSTQLSVAVTETTCLPPAEASGGARLPASGAQMLNADAIAKLRVVVVPVTLSGRTPDTSEAQLKKMRDELLALYPVADVEVTAHAPVTYSGAAQASGTGWSEVLSFVGRTRQADAPDASVYYFGVITPAATFREYCRTGCVAGLAPQTTFVSRANQIGLGVGYVDPTTASTMAHELGHAHGLPHAPCSMGGSIQGADTRFPYTGAKIGSWGWDFRSEKLKSPTAFVDLMSYCDPVWISDYNYAKITTRCKAVNSAAFIYQGDLQTSLHWRGLILHADGTARWSGMTSSELPGEPSSARVLDAHGSALRTIEVVRVALSHSDDTFLYLPDLDARAAAIDLGDRILSLDTIAAASE